MDVRLKPADPALPFVREAKQGSDFDSLCAGVNEVWADVVHYRWPLIWAILLGLLSRIQSLTNTMYSIDGYVPKGYAHFLEDGRWGLAVLFWLREQLGYSGIHVVPSSIFLATILFAGAGLLYARFILIRPTGAEAFFFVSLYTLHPFNTEMFTFSDMTLISALSTVIAAAGVAACAAYRKPWLSCSVGGVLILLALSINQLLIAHIGVVALIAIVARMLRRGNLLTDSSSASRRIASAPVRLLATTAVVAVVYLVSVAVAAHVMNAQLGRADQAQAFDLPKKLSALRMAFVLVLLPLQGFRTELGSGLGVGVLAASIALVLAKTQRTRGNLAAVLTVVLLGAAAICSVGVPVAVKDIWLVPRLLATFSIFSAAVTMLGLHCLAQTSWRPLAYAVIATVFIGYVGTSNSMLYDQHRINMWDVQEANRIVARLELDPKFSRVRSLAIQNSFWSYPIALPTAFGDLNISALYPAWSKIGLIEEATGLQFDSPSVPELALATRFCDRADIWPGRGSTTIVDTLAIVCAGHNPPTSAASGK